MLSTYIHTYIVNHVLVLLCFGYNRLGKLLCKRFEHAQTLHEESDKELKDLMQLSPGKLSLSV